MDRLGRSTFCLICIVVGAAHALPLRADALPWSERALVDRDGLE
jgi:hypothetical protein